MFSSQAIFGNTEVHFSSQLHGESLTFNAAETILMTVLLNEILHAANKYSNGHLATEEL